MQRIRYFFSRILECSFLPLQRRVSSRNNNIENIEVTSMSGLAGQQSKRLSAILEKMVLSIILFSWENEYLCVRRERALWVDRFVLPPTEDVPRREKVKVWGQICCRFSVWMMLNLWDIPVDWLLTMTSDYPLSAPALTCNLGIFHNNYH